MAFQAFLIALIIFVGKADYFVGTAMLGRPLVLGMLVGIALGDVSQGVIIGSSWSSSLWACRLSAPPFRLT